MTSPSLIQELTSLSISEEVRLFQLSGYDITNRAETFCFSNTIGAVFDRVSYNPIACKLEGVEFKADGAAPTPTLTVADPGGLISNLSPQRSFEGATLKVIVTQRAFLDDLPSADPTAIKWFDEYTVNQKLEHIPGISIKYELITLDFINRTFGRACTRKCPYPYRGPWCKYTGNDFFTIAGRRTLDRRLDECGRTYLDCEKRKNERNFGGILGLQRF